MRRNTLTQNYFLRADISLGLAELASRSIRVRSVPFCFNYVSAAPLLKKSPLDKHTCIFQLPAYFQFRLHFELFLNAYP